MFKSKTIQPAQPNRHKTASILPRATIVGPALGMVAAIMCFLACLTVGAALIISSVSQRWLTQASSALTVQLIEYNQQTAQEQVRPVLRILQQTPGIHHAEILPQTSVIELLEPWLGAGNVSDDLPLPILINLVPDSTTPLNIRALQIALKAVAPGARLDTHGRWRQALEQTIDVLRFLTSLILFLVTIATATVIIFATRAALTANRETLDVLYLAGAYDHYIARQFALHFLRLAFWACFIGYGMAVLAFVLAGHLLPQISFLFYVKLIIVPMLAIFMTWLITRHYVATNIRRLEITL